MFFYLIQLDNVELPQKCHDFVPEAERKNANMTCVLLGSLARYLWKEKDVMVLLRDMGLETQIGRQAYRALMRKPRFCFSVPIQKDELEATKEILDEHCGNRANHWNDFAQMFCLGCWFVKDSCVSAVHGYWINWIIGYERKDYREMAASMGDGSVVQVQFTDAEFELALYYTAKVMQYSSPEEAKTGKVTVTRSGGTMITERDRAINMDCNSFARALIFLQEARRTAIPSAKIEKYCSLLECLYALKEAHKANLSEITAAYIGTDSAEQAVITDTIRKAYGVRSDRSHGEDLGGLTARELETLSAALDGYTRRVFQKVIEDDSLNYDTTSERKAAVRAYFKAIRTNGQP